MSSRRAPTPAVTTSSRALALLALLGKDVHPSATRRLDSLSRSTRLLDRKSCLARTLKSFVLGALEGLVGLLGGEGDFSETRGGNLPGEAVVATAEKLELAAQSASRAGVATAEHAIGTWVLTNLCQAFAQLRPSGQWRAAMQILSLLPGRQAGHTLVRPCAK